MSYDPSKVFGAWGSDAYRASLGGQELRSSFLDEADFNRYYGLDGPTTQGAGQPGQYYVAGNSGDSATGGYMLVNAPTWNDSMKLGATPPSLSDGLAPLPPANTAPPAPVQQAPIAPPPVTDGYLDPNAGFDKLVSPYNYIGDIPSGWGVGRTTNRGTGLDAAWTTPGPRPLWSRGGPGVNAKLGRPQW